MKKIWFRAKFASFFYTVWQAFDRLETNYAKWLVNNIKMVEFVTNLKKLIFQRTQYFHMKRALESCQHPSFHNPNLKDDIIKCTERSQKSNSVSFNFRKRQCFFPFFSKKNHEKKTCTGWNTELCRSCFSMIAMVCFKIFTWNFV